MEEPSIQSEESVRLADRRGNEEGRGANISSAGTVLEVRQLTVEFPGVGQPVRDVSFDVKAGQRIGLVGESGAGKTLTGLAIMQLIRAPGRIVRGEILLNGSDLLRLDRRALNRIRGAQIAMIYQNPLSALNPVHRVGDQIVEAIREHASVSRKTAHDRAVQLLDEVGIRDPDKRFFSYPHQLSGGMRQRVMIAMALSGDPNLLIADEPTSALDVSTQARIVDLLLRLVEQRGIAVIFVSHDLAITAQFCSDIYVMYAGRIVEQAEAKSFYYARPIHPYSEALLRSIVKNTQDPSVAIKAIGGYPPSLGRLPKGCPFHPRCDYAIDVCKTEPPPRLLLDESRSSVVECHLASERSEGVSGRLSSGDT